MLIKKIQVPHDFKYPAFFQQTCKVVVSENEQDVATGYQQAKRF